MEKIYRVLVLLGLLLGLVVNAVATYRMKVAMEDTQLSIMLVATELQGNIQSIKASLSDVEDGLESKVAEHERLIVELERIVNTQLDK